MCWANLPWAVEHSADYLAFVYDGKTVLNVTGNNDKGPKLAVAPFYLCVSQPSPLLGPVAVTAPDTAVCHCQAPSTSVCHCDCRCACALSRCSILNTAVGGPWPQQPNASTRFPTYHTIDYVKVAVHGG